MAVATSVQTVAVTEALQDGGGNGGSSDGGSGGGPSDGGGVAEGALEVRFNEHFSAGRRDASDPKFVMYMARVVGISGRSVLILPCVGN